MHGGGGLGVGIQSESNGVVAQNAGHHLGAHAILDRQRHVGVVHIVEADILVDVRLLAPDSVEPSRTVGALYLSNDRGRKQDRDE